MSALEAILIAVSGFLVVMIMLMILWAVIVLINKCTAAILKKNAPAPVPKPVYKADEEAQPEKPHEIYGGEIALYGVDEKTAACIMAIVSDSSGIPLEHLIFKSIKALD